MQFWFSLYNTSPLLFLLNKHRLTKHTNADLFIIKKNTYRLVKEYGVKLIYFRHLLLQLNPTKANPNSRQAGRKSQMSGLCKTSETMHHNVK